MARCVLDPLSLRPAAVPLRCGQTCRRHEEEKAEWCERMPVGRGGQSWRARPCRGFSFFRCACRIVWIKKEERPAAIDLLTPPPQAAAGDRVRDGSGRRRWWCWCWWRLARRLRWALAECASERASTHHHPWQWQSRRGQRGKEGAGGGREEGCGPVFMDLTD